MNLFACFLQKTTDPYQKYFEAIQTVNLATENTLSSHLEKYKTKESFPNERRQFNKIKANLDKIINCTHNLNYFFRGTLTSKQKKQLFAPLIEKTQGRGIGFEHMRNFLASEGPRFKELAEDVMASHNSRTKYAAVLLLLCILVGIAAFVTFVVGLFVIRDFNVILASQITWLASILIGLLSMIELFFRHSNGYELSSGMDYFIAANPYYKLSENINDWESIRIQYEKLVERKSTQEISLDTDGLMIELR